MIRTNKSVIRPRLQTGELLKHAGTQRYGRLMEDIQDAEKAPDSEALLASLDVAAVAGLELRECPRCSILMEKVRQPAIELDWVVVQLMSLITMSPY